ncbi:MAG: hypothetical protein J5875_09060 [Paludibacteraceae bacterium]|nr:hypothetical protein [Paludibacteraceae bacterium]
MKKHPLLLLFLLLFSYLNSYANSFDDLLRDTGRPKGNVKDIIGKLNRKCVRYTQATAETAAAADVLVIDCIGILSSIYKYGELAYIGGGFGVGIHNILEPAVYGMPVVFGPNYRKFREAVEMEKAGGAFHIEDGKQLAMVLDSLMSPDSQRLAETSAIAKQFVAANSGATDLIMGHLFGK